MKTKTKFWLRVVLLFLDIRLDRVRCLLFYTHTRHGNVSIKVQRKQFFNVPKVGHVGTLQCHLGGNLNQALVGIDRSFTRPNNGIAKLGLVGKRVTVGWIVGNVVKATVECLPK